MLSSHSPAPFGDTLARARASWVREMARRLEILGYQDYRRSDPLLLRWLVHGTTPIATLSSALGSSRQAARKTVGGLVDRHYAEVHVDGHDARRRTVTLSALGEVYARDVIAVLQELDRQVRATIEPDELRRAVSVLEAITAGFRT